MIDEIFNFLFNALYENLWISVFASFSWGILSVLLSPCHLSSIPLIIGFINSQGKITTKRTFFLSFIFGIGILITIAAIGIITALIGRIMGDIGPIANYIIAIILIIMGLYLLEIISLSWNKSGINKTKFTGAAAALLLGLLFGIGLGPCTFAFMAPVLSVVFELAKTNLFISILLLTAFGLGHCSVIIAAGTLTYKVQQYLNWTENSKAVNYIKKICGILVILGGLYFIYITF